jgi:hypothetical protein
VHLIRTFDFINTYVILQHSSLSQNYYNFLPIKVRVIIILTRNSSKKKIVIEIVEKKICVILRNTYTYYNMYSLLLVCLLVGCGSLRNLRLLHADWNKPQHNKHYSEWESFLRTFWLCNFLLNVTGLSCKKTQTNKEYSYSFSETRTILL